MTNIIESKYHTFIEVCGKTVFFHAACILTVFLCVSFSSLNTHPHLFNHTDVFILFSFWVDG